MGQLPKPSELDNLSLEDVETLELMQKKKKEADETFKAAKSTAKLVSERKSVPEKPMKEEKQKQQKDRGGQETKKEESKNIREEIITVHFNFQNHNFSLTIPRNTTTGKLCSLIIELMNLPKKTKFRMMFGGNDIYVSGDDGQSFGLKRLHKVPVNDGDTIDLDTDEGVITPLRTTEEIFAPWNASNIDNDGSSNESMDEEEQQDSDNKSNDS
ncbi:unnamed protein product [Effrenium voratum]|uniref:Uncharacterized protein n=1 Tax=Effrenium voratum TaxID=2562239 RepID=A0AA36I5P1_9DINO|nr:unnamed protein product [Effrenium voratum]